MSLIDFDVYLSLPSGSIRCANPEVAFRIIQLCNISFNSGQMCIRSEVVGMYQLPYLLMFTADCPHEMNHANRCSRIGCEECCLKDDVLDVAATQLEALCEIGEVHIVSQRRLCGQCSSPNLQTVGPFRHREFYRPVHASYKRVVEVFPKVCGKDNYAVVFFHPLQQVTRLQVGISVMAVLDLTPLAKYGICFIEKEHCVAGLPLVENLLQIFLGFTDVFAHNPGEVNLVKLKAQVGCQDLGGHSLAGAGRACEQHVQTFTPGQLSIETPLFEDYRTISDVEAHFTKLGNPLSRQDEIGPSVDRDYFAGKKAQALVGMRPARRHQVAHSDRRIFFRCGGCRSPGSDVSRA